MQTDTSPKLVALSDSPCALLGEEPAAQGRRLEKRGFLPRAGHILGPSTLLHGDRKRALWILGIKTTAN